ncbi:MAG: hypothetical protein N2170_09925 [Bacteroidia bacterium]|nr:hypothetical protein [Bacteroidia bacterium]
MRHICLVVFLCTSNAQNLGIGTTAPTERLDVEGGRLRVRAYSGTGTRLATVDPAGVFGTLGGVNAGEYPPMERYKLGLHPRPLSSQCLAPNG